jgi:long-chain acyl-CoA synthetase
LTGDDFHSAPPPRRLAGVVQRGIAIRIKFNMDIATLPGLLRRNALRFGDGKAALREKEFGIWQAITWKAYYENVRDFALGLHQLGFQKGDKLSVIGDNRPEWFYSELAVQSLGGAVVGIYPDSHLDQVEYNINHSDSRFVMAGDQEQSDKILAIIKKCPNIEKIIVDDPKGMRGYEDPLLVFFKDVQKEGRKLAEVNPGLYDGLVDAISPDDVGMIIYTSGTTGQPKGSMITHRNMTSIGRFIDEVDEAKETDNYISFLPLSWIGEQHFALYWSLTKAFTVNFPERVETVQQNIREIGPNLMLAPPRIWEKMCSDIQVKIQDAAWIKRKVYESFLSIGYRMTDFKLQKKVPPLTLQLLKWVGHWLLFRSLKNYLGLAKVRHVYTGGAPLGPEIFHMFQALDVNIKQAYGMTELSGGMMIHRTDDIRLETVGKPLPGIEARISDEGELIISGDTNFKGYYKDPEATRKALKEGWFHTGDAALIDDDGQVIIIDRVSDVMKLADGGRFSPQLIENKLKFSPYIIDALVIGQDKPFITGMINIDMSNVGKWAETNQLPYTTFADLSQKERVYDLIKEEVLKINQTLPKVARVMRFVLLYKELDADDEELTRTRKVRRGFVAEKYKHLIDALYGDQEELEVESDIRYRDGKGFRMKTRVRVKRVEN